MYTRNFINVILCLAVAPDLVQLQELIGEKHDKKIPFIRNEKNMRIFFTLFVIILIAASSYIVSQSTQKSLCSEGLVQIIKLSDTGSIANTSCVTPDVAERFSASGWEIITQDFEGEVFPNIVEETEEVAGTQNIEEVPEVFVEETDKSAEDSDLLTKIDELQARVNELQAQVDAHKAERETTAKQLQIFDELDLVAFNNRDMTRIKQIHADDVTVYNPDGSITQGMTPHHADELQFLFDTFDFMIPVHIVGFGYGEWTAGISVSEGQWVKPITMSDGTVLEPTNKKLKIKIATIARWENGRIAEEHLFWDNASWNKQIGLDQCLGQ